MDDIRVLLVDDHRAVLEGFVARIENEPGVAVAGTAVNGVEALEKAKVLKPDVVLMDISMPVLNGIETTKLFSQNHPETKILILTMHDNREYIQKVMESGASGYILKDVSLEEMINAIKTVNDGASYFCQSSSKALFDMVKESRKSENKKNILSQRETTVLALVAKGLSSKKIAQQLDISVRTVETHRQNIKHKLNVSSTAEMVDYALRNNLT
ncbi:DNA-binding response regulator, LuxR family [Grimontia indica]|uniref:Oxygen regulatory protein NreC n=2 Tax=Grimontia TaxID=246861 RepID=A0A128F672_9GAMM|nr:MULTISPECIES: response regulator transcription factor [Grimontia]EOD78603.1 DNA-binding response regulator, LuxR family [Grimontia indica]CZF82307.1 Oxygen regulatory protein NreC [Grimontia marina]